jgi:hypothetical protein
MLPEREGEIYGPEQFKGDLRRECEMELNALKHRLETLDMIDEDALKTGSTRAGFAEDQEGTEGAKKKIKNSTQGFIDRELERKEIQRRIEAIQSVLEKLSK